MQCLSLVKYTRRATSDQIRAGVCGGTEQTVAVYAMLYDVHVFR
jgi:hypothetical protein